MLDECWTFTRLGEQVDADAASTTIVVCRRKHVPNSYVVNSSAGTVGLDFYQASRTTSLLVWLHVTASSDCVLIASSLNLMKYRET